MIPTIYYERQYYKIEMLNLSINCLFIDLRNITRTVYETVIVIVGQSHSHLKYFLLTTAALILLIELAITLINVVWLKWKVALYSRTRT